MSQLLVLYGLSTLLNAVQFTQLTTFTYVCKENDISDLHQGYLKTFAIGLQLVGTPLIGVVVDRWGLRLGLSMAFSCTALSSFILGASQGHFLVIVSQALNLLMVGHQAFQTAIAHLTKPGKERTTAFSRLGLAFGKRVIRGFGFALTPIISKLAVMWSGERGPLYAGGWICLISLPVLMLVKDPGSHDENKDQPKMKSSGSRWALLASDPTLRNLFVTKMLVTCPAYVIFGVLQLHLINVFSLSQTQVSFIQLDIGLSIIFANSVGQTIANRLYNEADLIKSSSIVAIAMYIMFMRLDSLWLVWIMLFLLVQAMSFVNNSADSLMTTRVRHEQQGLMLGLSNLSISFVRAASPTLAVVVIEELGFGYLGLAGALCALAGYVLSQSIITQVKPE